VSDAQAVDGCLAFAREHRVVVEPACGASVAATLAGGDAFAHVRTVLVVACGGVSSTYEQLQAWRDALARG
jgi:L-serine/L-threonine ammonia-lyase